MKKIGVVLLLLIGCGGSGNSDLKTLQAQNNEAECAYSCCRYVTKYDTCWIYEYQSDGVCACINPDYPSQKADQ